MNIKVKLFLISHGLLSIGALLLVINTYVLFNQKSGFIDATFFHLMPISLVGMFHSFFIHIIIGLIFFQIIMVVVEKQILLKKVTLLFVDFALVSGLLNYSYDEYINNYIMTHMNFGIVLWILISLFFVFYKYFIPSENKHNHKKKYLMTIFLGSFLILTAYFGSQIHFGTSFWPDVLGMKI